MKKRLILFMMLLMTAFCVFGCKKSEAADQAAAETEAEEASGEEGGEITVQESATIEIGDEEQGAFAPE